MAQLQTPFGGGGGGGGVVDCPMHNMAVAKQDMLLKSNEN